MAYISREFGFAFFAAPATGSSAVIKALQDAGIGEFVPAQDIESDGKLVVSSKHSTLHQLHDAGLAEAIEGLTKVVGVRNLFSWYVAKYLRNTKRRLQSVNNKNSFIHRLPEVDKIAYIERLKRHAAMTFAEFLEEKVGRRQSRDPHGRFQRKMDVYLHQERLDADFRVFAEQAGLPPGIAIKPFGVTGAMEQGKTYRDYYTPQLIDMVYEKDAVFFQRFPEYSFDGLDQHALPRATG
jgi:hypothetical protein